MFTELNLIQIIFLKKLLKGTLNMNYNYIIIKNFL